MNDSNFDPKELANFGRSNVKTNSKITDNGLLDPGDLVLPEVTDGTQKSAYTIGSKAILVGGVGLVGGIILLFGFSAFSSIFRSRPETVATATEESEMERLIVERDEAVVEAERERARAFLREQKAKPVALEGTQEPEVPKKPEVPDEPAPTVAPTPVARPAPRPAPARAPAPARTSPARPTRTLDPEGVWQGLQTNSIAFAPVDVESTPVARLSATVAAPAEPASEVLAPEEIAIATGKPLAEVVPSEPQEAPVSQMQVLPGTIVSGEQIVPATWNTATDSAGGIAAIQLDEPLRDAQGTIVLPKETMLLTQVVSVAENGWATQQAIAARWTDADSGTLQEVPLPEGALSIRGKKGEPLIADIANDSRRAERRNRRNRAALGALASVGQELTRAETSSSTTSSGLGSFSTSTTVDNGDRDVLGAALQGVGETLLDDTGRGSDPRDREPIYTVPANTRVEVVVEAAFALPATGANSVAASSISPSQ